MMEDDFKLLPPLYHIDHACQHKFCRTTITLTSLNPQKPSKTWQLLEGIKNSKYHYNHTKLHHILCINNQTVNDLSKIYTNQYEPFGLKAELSELECNTSNYPIGNIDHCILLVILAYFWLVFFAANRKTGWWCLFSFRQNYRNLLSTYGQRMNDEISGVQGIRFINTVLIIMTHTYLSYGGAYIGNTAFFEQLDKKWIQFAITNCCFFLVQTYFLISPLLLSYKTMKHLRKNNNINLFKFVIERALHRYFRLVPSLVGIILVFTNPWIAKSIKGPLDIVYTLNGYLSCRNNWWISILFLSNTYQPEEICYPISWYLSADTQLYILSLVILALLWKYQNYRKIIVALAALWGPVTTVILTYSNNFEPHHTLTPLHMSDFALKPNDRKFYHQYIVIYMSTYANSATYMLGLALGYCYFRVKNHEWNFKLGKFSWLVSMLGFPLLVISVTTFEYSRVGSALLVMVLKPMYSLGAASAIFGLLHHDGVVKRILNWKPIVFLGTITYSTYMVHFVIIFRRCATAVEVVNFNSSDLLRSFITDVIISFVIGFIWHIVFEMPFLQLQKFISRKKYND